MWIFRSLFVTLYDTRSYIYQASFVVHLYAISFASMTNTQPHAQTCPSRIGYIQREIQHSSKRDGEAKEEICHFAIYNSFPYTIHCSFLARTEMPLGVGYRERPSGPYHQASEETLPELRRVKKSAEIPYLLPRSGDFPQRM